jgi:hypothetical protein
LIFLKEFHFIGTAHIFLVEVGGVRWELELLVKLLVGFDRLLFGYFLLASECAGHIVPEWGVDPSNSVTVYWAHKLTSILIQRPRILSFCRPFVFFLGVYSHAEIVSANLARLHPC